MLNPTGKNAKTIQKELEWFKHVIAVRFQLYFGQECNYKSIYELVPPDLSNDPSIYGRTVTHFKMSFEERLILMLSLVPHIKPEVLDVFFTKNKVFDRIYTEFGGLKGRYHSGFLPTGETAVFLLAAHNIELRIRLLDLFKPSHFFAKHNILKLNINSNAEPLLSGGLEISDEYLTFLTSGKAYTPDFNNKFPAKKISTRLEWTDLVLDPHVLADVAEIQAWIQHQDTIMNEWGLSKQLKRGYRALFYGPPGTGKTLTACLLGKAMNLDVYRVDLSQVVSKYIGETEKNMANIFDQAENKNWILFFDEADALFGKRTATSDAKDRHANQEVAYLLQRVEDFSGVVILATNLKANMDIAFTRRFQSMIYFPAPTSEQRYKLWSNAFSGKVKVGADVDFNAIANEHTITGGSIINVLRYCSLAVLRRGSNEVNSDDIREGIKRELRKEGKTLDTK